MQVWLLNGFVGGEGRERANGGRAVAFEIWLFLVVCYVPYVDRYPILFYVEGCTPRAWRGQKVVFSSTGATSRLRFSDIPSHHSTG